MAASLSARPHRYFFQFIKSFCASHGVRQLSSGVVSKEQKVASFEQSQEIVIPKKKRRDSLSVLQALASTVTRDTGAPDYKYVDDPYLIPTSNLSKKSFALSKESGRKAARYFLENYAQFFNDNPAEPSVETFMAPELSYVHTEASEAALLERIEKRRVRDAVDVYNKTKQENIEISQETCSQFLELLCVYNGEDPPASMMPEEFFFRKVFGHGKKPASKTWKDDGIAERIFDELKEKTSDDHQNLIRGMARYQQTEKAFSMYDEMVEKKMPIDRLTFNELIRVATFHGDTYETRWNLVESLLNDMQMCGVQPDLSTFNNVLFVLDRMPLYPRSPSLALQILNEMKALNIEPSLVSWKYILTVFYPKEHYESNILYKIMDYLEGKEFTHQHINDDMFFVNAMNLCLSNIHDPELAMRINKLVNVGDNVILLGDSIVQNIYYSCFLRLICMFETLDKIMEVYQQVTPHLWTPNLVTLEELFKALELQEGFQYLPLMWTDLLLFDFHKNTDILEKLLQLMAKQKQEANLQSQFCHIAHQLLERWNEEEEYKSQRKVSTGSMIGHLILIAENGEDHELAWKVFDMFVSNQNMFMGSPSDAAIKALVTGCLEHGDSERVVTVLNKMNSMEMVGTGDAAQLVLDSDKVVLSSAQRDFLASM